MILKRGDKVIMQYPVPGTTDRYTTPEEAERRIASMRGRVEKTMKLMGVEVIAWEAFSLAREISILAVFREEEK